MPALSSDWSAVMPVPPYLYAPAAVLAWLLAGWLGKKIALRRLRAWAARTATDWDDLLVEALDFPLTFLILVSGLALLVRLLPMPGKADRVAMLALQGAAIFAAVCFLDALVRGLLGRSKAPSFSAVSQGVTKGLVRAFVITIGALIFLDQLGISITPILASLGIGSLAVALALQDTLSNFFAGLHVAIDKPVQEGDFVRLESGQEGTVIEVGWRSTRLRTPSNNVVVIPNKKFMDGVITNYSLPDREIAVLVEMGVHYGEDLDRVERVASDVGRDVMQRVPGGVAEFEPMVRFHTLADSSVNFTVVLRGVQVFDAGLIKHEFIKTVHERFRKEGIAIPYPTRTLEFSEATAARIGGAAAGPRR